LHIGGEAIHQSQRQCSSGTRYRTKSATGPTRTPINVTRPTPDALGAEREHAGRPPH
jgi:hypothetical protein